jgi:hypothetical protein
MRNATITEKRALVIGYFKDEKSEEYKQFVKLAEDEENDDEFDFVSVINPSDELVKGEVGNGFAVLHTFFEQPQNTTDIANLQEFLNVRGLPLVDYLDDRTRRRYEKPKRPVIMLFMNVTDEHVVMETANTLKPVMEEFRDRFMFGFADSTYHRQALLHLGGKLDARTTITAFKPKNSKKYSFPHETVEVDTVKTWLDDVHHDRLDPFIFSEPVPETPSENGIVKVVGRTFREIVNDETKDVLVEFYASEEDSIHRKFQKQYNLLASKVANIDNLVIAQINIGKNDIPVFVNPPTVAIFPSKKKELPRIYQGSGLANDLVKFLAAEAIASKDSISKLLQAEEKRKDEL